MGSAASNVTTPRDFGTYDPVYLPSIGAMLHLNGIGLNWHSLEAANLTTGVLGVALANVATPTAARATATLTFTVATVPADGDIFYLANVTDGKYWQLRFKTTLTTTFEPVVRYIAEIKIGSGGTGAQNLAATIANIAAFVNGTGTEGTEYHWRESSIGAAAQLAATKIIVSATSATTVTFRATVFGTGPNTWVGVDTTGAGVTWTISNFSGGSTGTGVNPPEGSYKYRYSRLRNSDQAISYASPEVAITQSAPGAINLTSFVAGPTRDGIDFYRWDRTLNGGSIFYRGADIATGTGEPYVDSFSDTTLSGAFSVKYDDRIYRPYTAGYPVKCRFGALYKGRVFAGGVSLSAKRSVGNVTTTNGAYTVTFTTAAHPTVDWIGRTFAVSGDVQTYILVDMNESSRVATLNLPYNGAGGSGQVYAVTDDRNPLLVYYSEPLLPNNWPVQNSVLGITSQDPSGVSGLKTAWDSLVVWTQTSVHRILGDTGSGFRAVPVGDGMGAFCNQTIVNVEGLLYWLGKDGIYKWGGDGSPSSISNPVGDDFPQLGIKRTIDRINVAQRDMAFGNYNPSEQVIRWWVALDGSTTNRDVIVYDLQTRTFSMDTADDATCATTVPDGSASYRTLVGNTQGSIFQLDLSTSDGVYGIDRVLFLTSQTATTNTLTLTTSTLPTTNGGIAGCPVVAVDALDGTAYHYTAASNTSGAIVLTGPSVIFTGGAQILVGSIYWRVRTGRWDLEQAFVQRGLPAITTTGVPSTGQMWCAVAKDNDDPTLYAPGAVRGFSACDVFDTSLASGYKLWWFRRGKCRRFLVEFFGYMLGPNFGLVGWIPTVAQADSVGG